MTAGDTFGDYRVVRRLGKGGMGEAWLLKSASGKQVAAKILDPESSADHESLIQSGNASNAVMIMRQTP